MSHNKQDYECKYVEYAGMMRVMIVNCQGCPSPKMVACADCARDALKLHPYYLAHRERIATAQTMPSGEPACYVPELKEEG